jgi:hypothetical protein
VTAMCLLLALAQAQDPVAETVPEAQAPAVSDRAAEDRPAETALPPEPAAAPWEPPDDPALRSAEGLPLLGPWPDGHEPDGPVHRAWPLVDVVSGEVLQPGRPYGQAEGALGPAPAPELVFEREPGPVEALPQPVSVAPGPAPPADESQAALPPDLPVASPGLLPRIPQGSGLLALFWLLVALATTAFARTAPDRVAGLRSGGVLPTLLRAAGLTARVVAIVASVLTVLYSLPPGARGLVPWVLIGLALSLGLAAWGLFRDVLALVVLSLERRLVAGRHVRLGDIAGAVVSQGPRAVTLQTAGGSLVTVPNWRFLSEAVHLDDDPRALVEVRLRVPPQAPRERVHRVLEELVLLSPYAVTRGRPGVRPDADDPAAWWVEARLLDAKWARAFERTLVELTAERL